MCPAPRCNIFSTNEGWVVPLTPELTARHKDLYKNGARSRAGRAGKTNRARSSMDELEGLRGRVLTCDRVRVENAMGEKDAVNLPLSNIDHGGLGRLSDDDHVQYALLAGRSGGQTIYGGTASGQRLKLRSTRHATKGSIDVDDGSTVRLVDSTSQLIHGLGTKA